MKNKTTWFAAILAIAACLLGAACNGGESLDASAVQPVVGAPTPNGGGPLKTTLDAPIISVAGATQTTITIKLCAPDSQPGVPAGFSLQWTDYATYTALGGFPDSTCDGSFAGEANHDFVLAPKQCVLIEVGNLDANERGVSFTCNSLNCGTEYVFRAFSHGNESYKRSPFTAPLYAWTAPCYAGCTYTQGYWKNHPSDWPVTSLVLGTVTYTEAQLLDILHTSPAGNGLITLAHQLIAAKLNLDDGASATSISATIATADAKIGALVVPPVPPANGYLAPADTSALVAKLTSFNEGSIGPGSCE